ncbi:helix-turn-helix domain-containing protein [Geomonas anaerohicana]|uniref:DNA-binding transcriptional regulator n=1 Tax=Geomonas anaerohicana TaxID=2798583 RepID=A0ABS0YAM1_9BACT|nr:DNA-binding transcriptional regulator [Geomonas anaerohicana]MBJ6748967.1 DNA-binding transcriptional regulator [Geomonas anaerohicana]
MSKPAKSDIAAAVHEAANDLYEAGIISARTMRGFDKTCLTTVEPLSPEEIVDVRRRSGVSQAVFAQYLNVTPGVVSKWERGEKRPTGASLKLLSLVKCKGLQSIA